MRPSLALCLAAAILAACVPYPGADVQAPDTSTTLPKGDFALLDAGAAQQDSLHFRVYAYGPDAAKAISDAAEADYNRIMVDTNLFSFQQSGIYHIVVYANQDEYRRKTRQPQWSGGVTVGNSIYSFYGPALERTIAHEMTHLIWFEFMGRVDPSQRWINEGLAVYEEEKAAGGGTQLVDLFAPMEPSLRASPIPMDQMINLTPATERDRTVSLWYAESVGLVTYMIQRGGRIGFSQFLQTLQQGQTPDQAIAGAYPGVWNSIAALQQAWVASLL